MVEVSKRLVDVEEYYKMAEVGILKPADRVELIHGEIIEMSPVGSKHASIVNRLVRILNELLKGNATISSQNPIRLGVNDEPEPDISILKYRADDYSESHPCAADVLALIEVSDTTYQYDKQIKASLYAKNSIPILWIIDLNRTRIEVYKFSDKEEYLKKEVLGVDDKTDMLSEPISVKEIFSCISVK